MDRTLVILYLEIKFCKNTDWIIPGVHHLKARIAGTRYPTQKQNKFGSPDHKSFAPHTSPPGFCVSSDESPRPKTVSSDGYPAISPSLITFNDACKLHHTTW